ncbi:MAG TPA: DUF2269 family protein [Acidimicrobiia bacterium]|nr:DUF2269 family protein [Acidimicrobiia bacterium]
MRDGLLFLHILGVTAWLGGGLHSAYTYSALARMEAAAAGPAIERLHKLEDRFFGPATLVVLLTGIGLVLDSEAYGWGDTFVIMGLATFVIAAILGSTVGKKNGLRLVAATSSGSGVSEALRSWQRSALWDVLILLVTLWAMIVKLGA